MRKWKTTFATVWIWLLLMQMTACPVPWKDGYLKTFCEGLNGAEGALKDYEQGRAPLEKAFNAVRKGHDKIRSAASGANDDNPPNATRIHAMVEELWEISKAMQHDLELGTKEFNPVPARKKLVRDGKKIADCSDTSSYRNI